MKFKKTTKFVILVVGILLAFFLFILIPKRKKTEGLDVQKPDCAAGEIMGEVNGKYYCLRDEEPRAEYMMEDGQMVKINYDVDPAPNMVSHEHFSNGMSNNCPEPPPGPACEKCVEPSFDCKSVPKEDQQPIKLPEFEEPPLSYGLFGL